MHLMICSLPSSFNNAFVCRKIYANGVRAEPMKKANENRFFMAQVHHGFDDNCSNGGRTGNLASSVRTSSIASVALCSDTITTNPHVFKVNVGNGFQWIVAIAIVQ